MRRVEYDSRALQGGRRAPPLGTADLEVLHSLCMAGAAGPIAGCSPNIISWREMCGAKKDRSYQGDRSYSNFTHHIFFNRDFIQLCERRAIWGWRYTHVDAGPCAGDTLHGLDRHPSVPRGAYTIYRVYAQNPIGHQWRAYHAGLSV